MSAYGRRDDPLGAAASAYRQSRVMSSTPVQLVVMLYERLLADLKGAAIAIRAGDLEAKAEKVQQATDVIFELLGSLDQTRGGEVGQRLAALYSYMISRVGQASRALDAAGMDEVAGHVESLLTAWSAVANEPSTTAPPPPA
jgi:flagellar secretion chaperone FliS